MRLILRGDEAHHLTRVRRYGPGDEVEAVDGAGFCYRVRIERVAKGQVEAAIIARLPEKGESPVRLHLAPALIKGPRFDFVVEKATEVGVASIRPLLTERGVIRTGSERKLERWSARVRCVAALTSLGTIGTAGSRTSSPLSNLVSALWRLPIRAGRSSRATLLFPRYEVASFVAKLSVESVWAIWCIPDSWFLAI